MEKGTIIEGEAVPVTQIGLGTVFNIPAVRQILLLIGVAGSVAAGFAIVLWSQTPGQARLYEGLDSEDVAQIVDVLRSTDIEFELNMDTGTIVVPESSLDDARLELASQGLPRGSTIGMRSLQEQPTFGQSQFRENALYQHALEGELGRTVAHIGAIREARVHLALPKQSAFLRNSKPASASVMLNLYRGRELEGSQVASIVHLVASSVPNLLASNVTVIDQQGRLLSSGDEQWSDSMTTKQFQLANKLEQNFKQRIETLLTPLLGPGRIRAEVVADVDFTVIEETRESFNPNGALVSEHISQNRRDSGSGVAIGVPGALSNQPPEAGGIDVDQQAQGGATRESQDSSSSSTRNYELDRTISHTRPTAGAIRRLSVAVLIDDSPWESNADSAAGSFSDADIERFKALVKEAVGFNEARGDTVVVVTAAFKAPPELEPVADIAFWAKPAFMDSIRLVLGAVLVLALAFGLVRPMLKSLLAANQMTPGGMVAGGPTVSLVSGGFGQLPGSSVVALPSFDEKVAAAKNISGHDPAKVAQVVRKWVETGDG